jgi:hypothetical protein
MTADALGLPTIIVPYPGPATNPGEQDLFVYLRPETNGVLVESTLLKVIRGYGETQFIKLIYLANYPGEFIVKNTIVEQYYSLKLHFAVTGKRAFTEKMIQSFERSFNTKFETAPIYGSFEALSILGTTPEDLFGVWVQPWEMTTLNGQSVKKIKDIYVVNYDIPALVHKNTKGTDIAVMIFRTKMGYDEIKQLVSRMWEALVKQGVLNPQFDSSRAFHHSKSPFEQTLDAISYLFANNREHMSLKDFTFPRYLMANGIPEDVICGLMRNPIVHIQEPDGSITEDSIFSYGHNCSYEEALDMVRRIVAQMPIIHHGPLIDDICKNCMFE